MTKAQVQKAEMYDIKYSTSDKAQIELKEIYLADLGLQPMTAA